MSVWFSGRRTMHWVCFAVLISLVLIFTGCGGTSSSNNSGGGGNSNPPPPTQGDIKTVKHIIYTLQENRSFDSYFGKLDSYRVANGLGQPGDVDGLPASPSTSPCDAAHGCQIGLDGNAMTVFHLKSACFDNLDPDWLSSHGDFNFENPGSDSPLLDGYLKNAAVTGVIDSNAGRTGTLPVVVFESTTFTLELPNTTALATVIVNVPGTGTSGGTLIHTPGVTFTANGQQQITVPANTQVTLSWSAPTFPTPLYIDSFVDIKGKRAMGYYDQTDLPYYYFMASNFATSDRWYSPMPGNTAANRVFLMAATTHGHAHNPPQLPPSVKPIFAELQAANISWKVYYQATNKDGSPQTTLSTFLVQQGSQMVPFSKVFAANIVPISQYFTDVANGTLPSVAFIEQKSGIDEHPGAEINVQVGAQNMAKIINALMNSPSWKDSVFIYAVDEFGGAFDHVAPQLPVPSPDGLMPTDLQPGDSIIQPPGDFTRTGFRVPMIVISPFTKKNYVSHTSADNTAILAFIEKRFGLQPLTARDAAQMDMTEFFNFATPPWATPPTPPQQPANLPCNPGQLQ